MAASRQSKAFHRREQESREAQVRRRLTYAVAGVFGAVALLVIAGLIWGVYLPPRATVATVGDREITAGELKDHAAFIYRSGDTRVAEDLSIALTDLIQREILTQAGATEVEPVTAEDIRASMATRLGLAEDATDEQYGKALGDFLTAANLSRAEVEEAVRLQLIDQRLRDKFREGLPASGEQLHIVRAATNDRTRAEAVREAVLGGQPLGEAAVEAGVYTETSQAELGWYTPDTLPERLRETLVALQAGDVTEVLDDANRVGFEVYQVDQREQNRTYDDAVKTQVANQMFEQFIEAKREALGVVEDFSDGERSWVINQVRRAVR
ncbi:MAG: hypothetical protein AMXMBFR23_12760 [Chloroflexota bacterium]